MESAEIAHFLPWENFAGEVCLFKETVNFVLITSEFPQGPQGISKDERVAECKGIGSPH